MSKEKQLIHFMITELFPLQVYAIRELAKFIGSCLYSLSHWFQFESEVLKNNFDDEMFFLLFRSQSPECVSCE
jgi:hypothetical protein